MARSTTASPAEPGSTEPARVFRQSPDVEMPRTSDDGFGQGIPSPVPRGHFADAVVARVVEDVHKGRYPTLVSRAGLIPAVRHILPGCHPAEGLGVDGAFATRTAS